MKVLVVGSGGREHALCWNLARSPRVDALYCAPGNPGTAQVAERVAIGAEDLEGLAVFAERSHIDLTVVGPEQPLVAGIAEAFAARGLALLGPSAAAAALEGSKAFAKEFLVRQGIPTARSEIVTSEDVARRAARELGLPVVLKADGLAAGKGVLIPETEEELERALVVFFAERRFGDSGDTIVVEEHLTGEEVSSIAVSDGERLLVLATAKDYKRIGEGDSGPNTGGMGAHSPSGLVDQGLARRIEEEILRPTVAGMVREGRPFRGFLYAGLMLTDDGPKVLEFNVRLGDPEAQALLLRLESDLVPVLAGAAAGRLPPEPLRFLPAVSACVVLTNEGYPDKTISGDVIEGLDGPFGADVEVFHAGTGERDGGIVATGGRVLNVCARGDDLAQALERAYAAVAGIRWPRRVLRRDIGRRMLERPGFAAL
ncbi:MAG: phosphoribosylamine--glycine ligase [Thermoanaerobaculia bacterium]